MSVTIPRSTLSYTESPNYRPDIDGLRAVAVIMVILCHAFPAYFSGGFIGVDIFFVISGYLISSILFRSNGKGSFSFIDFYAKRARRIFPALVFVLLVGAFFLTPREYKELGAEAMLGSIFVENIRLARGIDYFGLEIARKPFMHLWSLGIEEQFYILFPFLLWLAWKLLKGRVGWLLFACVAASFAAELYYQSFDASKAYFLPHARFWQLGAGVLLAYVHYRAEQCAACDFIRRFLIQQGHWLSVIALASLAGALVAFGAVSNDYPGCWALVPTVCAVVLIGAGKQSLVNRYLLAHPVTVYIGWLSYPMYLWHWLFLSLSFSVYSGHVPFAVTCAAVGLTCVFAFVSFTWIEVPCRRLPPTKKVLLATLSVLFLVGALSGLVSKQDGLPQRLSEHKQSVQALITNDREVAPEHRCSKAYDFVCWSQTGRQDGNVLLIGNSHTEHLLGSFAQTAPAFARVDVYAAGGTYPLEDMIQGTSAKQLIRDGKMHQVLREIRNSSARLVVVSNTWGTPDPTQKMMLRDGTFDTFDRIFGRTVSSILASGKKLVYLVDTPRMPSEMESCMGLRPVNLLKGRCSMPRAEYDAQSRAQTQYFEKWARTYPGQVFVVRPGYALCNEQSCSMLSADGMPLYTDDNHLTTLGGAVVSKRIWQEITPLLQTLSAPE